MKDVVVLIPGIGGSALSKDGQEIWSLSAGAALRGVLSMGRSIDRLRLQDDDPEADDLGDGVVATRLLPDFHVVPVFDWRVDGYGRFAAQMVKRFGCEAGRNYFELPYDWRRDNRVAARALTRKAHVWLRDWRERSGNDGAKLVLVGHSMGGIVARLYLELLEGWRHTRALISLGTPYSGSVNALEFLANGFRKGWGPQPAQPEPIPERQEDKQPSHENSPDGSRKRRIVGKAADVATDAADAAIEMLANLLPLMTS